MFTELKIEMTISLLKNLTMKFLVSLYYIAYYVYKCLISGFDLLQFLLVQDMQRNDFSVKF